MGSLHSREKFVGKDADLDAHFRLDENSEDQAEAKGADVKSDVKKVLGDKED